MTKRDCFVVSQHGGGKDLAGAYLSFLVCLHLWVRVQVDRRLYVARGDFELVILLRMKTRV